MMNGEYYLVLILLALVAVRFGGTTNKKASGSVAYLLVAFVCFLVSERVSAQEADAVATLQKLNSVTTAGVNFREYSSRLLDAKGDFDRAMLRVPASSKSRQSLQRAMDAYLEARKYWSYCITNDGRGVSYFPDNREVYEAMKASGYRPEKTDDVGMFWAYASSQIQQAQASQLGSTSDTKSGSIFRGEYYYWVIFWAIVGGVIGAVINVKKRWNGLVGFLGGALLGPIFVWLFLIQRENREGLKKCPFCAEWVKNDANVCKFCHKELPPAVQPAG